MRGWSEEGSFGCFPLLPLWEKVDRRAAPRRMRGVPAWPRSSPRLQTFIAHIGNDRITNRVQIFQNVIVPEAQDAKTPGLQVSIALLVVARLRVLAAIDLDDEPSLGADEVGNEPA